jgi:hypothetical protein
MQPFSKPNSQSTPVAPLFIGPLNAVDVCGHPWRWVRNVAKQLGVRMITPPGSSKTLIPAHELVAALERAGKLHEPEAPIMPEPGSADELAAMRSKLSLRRVGGAR